MKSVFLQLFHWNWSISKKKNWLLNETPKTKFRFGLRWNMTMFCSMFGMKLTETFMDIKNLFEPLIRNRIPSKSMYLVENATNQTFSTANRNYEDKTLNFQLKFRLFLVWNERVFDLYIQLWYVCIGHFQASFIFPVKLHN